MRPSVAAYSVMKVASQNNSPVSVISSSPIFSRSDNFDLCGRY
jgi:hypothetical protein